MSGLTSPLAADLPAGQDPPREGFWQRLWRGACRLRRRADWDRFAGPDWAGHIMDLPVTDRFHAKQGRSTGRLVLKAGAQRGPERLTVYLKRHYQLPWWQGLLAVLWPRGGWSPAFREWAHLEWARQQGVPVPKVVAAGEFIGPGCRLRSFLAVEELTGMLPLHEAIPLAARTLPADTFRRWKRALIAELARLARMLHDRRTFHKDFYLCHFYIARDDTRAIPDFQGRVHLIDLHRLTYHPWTWRLWQVKDLAQLLYSTEIPGLDDRDRLRFWRDYRGPGPWRSAQSWLRRWVLFKWRRYRHHNLRRKAALPHTDPARPGMDGD
jgi:heptose I phosphotransferase